MEAPRPASRGAVEFNMTNKAAQELGRLAKGKPKTLTKAERKRRAERLAEARKKRWPVKANAELSDRRSAANDF